MDVLVSLERQAYTIRNASDHSLLWRLAEHTDIITRNDNRSVTVQEYIETPYTEHGIVDKQELFRRLLGSVATDYHWEGSFAGPHHLMWPRTAYCYPAVSHQRAETTAHYRGCPSLKVILPRELHDFTHRVTEPPQVPDLDVMEQYLREQEQVRRLYATIYHANLADHDMTIEQKEALRMESFLRKLDAMEDGYVGLMPDKELLVAQPLSESRALLRHRALPLGISAHRACQKTFFTHNLE